MMNNEIDNRQNMREKIGIVVFVCTILTIFIGVATYMYFSHAFDLTATDIDENVGQLNDYAAIVFEGTNTTRQVTQNTQNIQNSQNTNNISNEQNNANNNDDKEYEKATVDNVSRIYWNKSATTVTIRTNDYKAYENGEIIERDNWRIGLLSITQQNFDSIKSAYESAIAMKSKTTPVIIEEFQKKIDNLRLENKASMVILISPDQDILKYVSKVDCLLAERVEKEVDDDGKLISDSYVMPIPRIGEIGALISSPAKMFSGNVYTKVEVKQTDKESSQSKH